jgi:cytochrome c oxidase subunit 2
MKNADSPLAYLHTAGPAADPITRLGWGLAAVSVGVVIIISALLVMAIFRKRNGTDSGTGHLGGPLMPVRERAGLTWIYVGTGISAIVLFACAVWTLWTLAEISAPGTAPRVVVQVQAFQFWWRLRYLDPSGAVVLTTANEVHIPAGEPVRFELTSGDVIHSFWVPSLGGKMDVLPGQTNVTWLQGSQVGRFRGQCGEYCGAQHAHMALFVDVDTPAGFARWVAAQRRDADPASGAATGARIFADKCGGCHAVRGSDAKGSLGPDLTHLMARQTIAAGTLPNGPAYLRRWITATQAVKPGAEMPVVPLAPAELDAVIVYLETLH